MRDTYDLVIVGAGPGGYVAARKAARMGMTVALIDRGPVGGTCINRGCIPAKALLHAATLYREMEGCERFGLHADGVSFDLQKIYRYKDMAADRMRRELEEEFCRLGVDLIRGSAVICKGRMVRVTDEEGKVSVCQGKNILVAAGAKANLADIPGMELPGVMTSEELLTADAHRYDRMLILGGGVIGLELATVFQSLGTEVTVVEISDRLLPNMDREFSDALERILTGRGIRICKESILERIEREKESGRLACRFVCDGRNNKEIVDAVLVSVGRSPATEGLFESDVPVKLERGRIVVDDFFRTNIPGVYAVGDVTGGIQLAHVASAQAAYVVERMNGRQPSVIISMVPGGLFTPVSIIPSCIYTDPEIASVGLTEEEARRKGVPVRCGKYVMQGNGQSIITGEEEGFIKVLFAPDSDELLGAQLMCPRDTDMIGELATALANGLTSTQLLYAMRAHPTFNEAISCAVEDSRRDFPV